MQKTMNFFHFRNIQKTCRAVSKINLVRKNVFAKSRSQNLRNVGTITILNDRKNLQYNGFCGNFHVF
ncbi:hypothetical protein LEP1GSC056_0724 [Leptospira borgpetersenii str. Brem 328]|uniref:Uncharacterized protein n=1 Tax=Leptospira borgpetersenii str. Brem 328 TaxID=1049780 RepID=A0ABC9SE40_LEPBO|nr:hypothetical protein LEP1GSC056_0724 [Leptospira borgpetersenii str. Brem 328]